MPFRCDRSAPRFNPDQPRELRRYFADVAVHFARSEIDDDQERKRYACRYVDIDTEELWESRLEYSDRAKSFSDFVQAIYRLYPGSDGQRQWLVADMERLVEERSRICIRTLGDLGDFYRRFITITTFLRSRNRLSERDQSQAFMQGLSREFCDRVLQRLQLKFPDHLSDDPHHLDDIYDVAQFILHGTATSVSITATLCDPFIDPKSPDIAKHRPSSREVANRRISSHKVVEHHIESPRVTEDHVGLPGTASDRMKSPEVAECRVTSPNIAERRVTSPKVAECRVTSPNIAGHRMTSQNVADHRIASCDIAEHCLTSLSIAGHRPTSHSSPIKSPFDRASRSSAETPLCNFCGRPGHFIRQCPDAEEYIQLGRCRRTSEGKIALPTGSFVSRDIPGRFMKLRIDEWHHRNSGYLRTRSLHSGLSTPITSALHVSSCATPQNVA
jgi:hypothetical protein